MLNGSLLENKSDVKVLGDALDLVTLHQSVRKIMLVIVDYEVQNTQVSDLLVAFLERLELAYVGNDLTAEIKTCNSQLYYFGFSIPCMELLIVNFLLRSLAGYTVTDLVDKVNVILLENIAVNAVAEAADEDLIAMESHLNDKMDCIDVRQLIRQEQLISYFVKC